MEGDRGLTVEERIEILRAEARREDIYSKASLVACELGVREPKSHGSWHYYPVNPHRGTYGFDAKTVRLEIAYDDYGGNMTIHWGEVQVFGATLGQITRYRPDIKQWKEKLEELSQQLRDQEMINQAIALAKRETEVRDNWGIKP